jgi:hypothetical protein
MSVDRPRREGCSRKGYVARMEIDWSSAEVKQAQGDEFEPKVTLRGTRDEAWLHDIAASAQALGTERRQITDWMTSSDAFGIVVRPVDVDDVDGERPLFTELVERANRRAEPLRARYEAETRQKQEEGQQRERHAHEATDRFPLERMTGGARTTRRCSSGALASRRQPRRPPRQDARTARALPRRRDPHCPGSRHREAGSC